MEILKITATLKAASTPLGFGAPVHEQKNADETHEQFDARTWREKCHVNSKGQVLMNAMAIKKALHHAAKRAGDSIPGKGKQKFAPRILEGVVIEGSPVIHVDGVPITKEHLGKERLYVPSDGKVGGTTRVWRTFPVIEDGWSMEVSMLSFDPDLNANVERVEEYLVRAGMMGGLGRYRPSSQSGGHYGRFTVENFTTEKV